MHLLPLIHWDFDPIALSLGPMKIHWYGLCWAVAFISAECGVRRQLAAIGHRDVDVGGLIVWALLGTLVGARLAHCFFYDPSFYIAHPLRILAIWEGGLASHGGAIGLIAALCWAAPRHAPGVSVLTLLDAASPSAALGAALIRVANFLNAEIVGNPTDGQWGVVFDRLDAVPRHPVQLYEAAAYLLVLIVLRRAANRGALAQRGHLTGLFLTLVFAARIALETWKTPQAVYEAGTAFTVGQWLSLPFFLLGLVLVMRARQATLITA